MFPENGKNKSLDYILISFIYFMWDFETQNEKSENDSYHRASYKNIKDEITYFRYNIARQIRNTWD